MQVALSLYFAQLCDDHCGVDNSPWPLGPVLEAARTARGLATKEAARRAGVSDTLWRSLERGFELRKGVRFRVSPRPETVVKVCRVVGIDPKRALELADLPTANPDDFDEPDLAGVSDEHLLDEVRRRMQLRSGRRTITRDEIDAGRFEPVGDPTPVRTVDSRADRGQ